MSSKFHLIALALVAAAVAAPIAQGKDNGTLLSGATHEPAAAKISGVTQVDPWAVSILQSYGWSAERIQSWTQGACSYQVKPVACYLIPARARLASKRLTETALAAPTAFGGVRPDDRAGTHGATAPAGTAADGVSASSTAHLTDMRGTDPRTRGPAAKSAKSSRGRAVRPDDRAGVRGA
jgi:hypothetical protein